MQTLKERFANFAACAYELATLVDAHQHWVGVVFAGKLGWMIFF